jgi:8-oxo-dGTP diphosphatase
MPTFPLTYTLCFLTRGDDILMLLRDNPPNAGLWNGVGGHIDHGETPLESCLREVHEETGYRVQQAHFGGVLTWDGFEVPPGGLYIFIAAAPPGDPAPIENEGRLAWKTRRWVCSAPEVVSNIHHFLPPILGGEPPRHYYFNYSDGVIMGQEVNPLPDDVNPQLPAAHIKIN